MNLKPCSECDNEDLSVRTDIAKDKREFVCCEACGNLAPKNVWNRIAPVAGETYDDGRRNAWIAILHTCIRNLGRDPEIEKAELILERADVVSKLRVFCQEVDSNDWKDEDYLPDVMDRHVLPYLDNII